MIPSWSTKSEFIFFPVRSDISNHNWIDTLLFLGLVHFYTYTGSNLLRMFYQFKQGSSAVIWIKAQNDKELWNKLTPRSFAEVFEFVFGQKHFSPFIFLPIYAPEKDIE